MIDQKHIDLMNQELDGDQLAAQSAGTREFPARTTKKPGTISGN